uniref:CCAAT/enhancer-binding protein delta-like isoform X4 n=1 Tax=Pristiophorus japonicus TaxID=55135 RepID=UPI00398ED43B
MLFKPFRQPLNHPTCDCFGLSIKVQLPPPCTAAIGQPATGGGADWPARLSITASPGARRLQIQWGEIASKSDIADSTMWIMKSQLSPTTQLHLRHWPHLHHQCNATLEARSPGHGERPQIFCPLAGEVDTGDILSTIDFGQSQDLFGVFPAGGPPVGGREEEEERQPGATSTSPPSSPPPSSSSNGRRGAKRRGQRGADGDCGCAKSSRGGTEQGQERQVAELTAENERLRARIDQLAAEVQEARRMLIERMVNAN